MNRATRLIAGGSAVCAGATAATLAIAQTSWIAKSKLSMNRLRNEGRLRSPASYTTDQLEGLPEPVQRYFRHVLTPGQPIVRTARARHRGTFRPGGRDSHWTPFVSWQQYTTMPRGFIWDAKMEMMPLLPLRVRDSYQHGRGSIKARIASMVTVADLHDDRSLDAGSLHRWLAEAVWFPTALLPSEGVKWTPVDGSTARASVRDGACEVSLDFTFDDRGEIIRAFTSARMREVDGAAVPTPWVGLYCDYDRRGPMMIPQRGEVAWIIDDARLPYWRGTLESIEHD